MIAFSAALTVATTYLLATLLQTVLHRLLGHGAHGGWFRRVHLEEHHANYSGRRLSSDRLDKERSLTPFYVAPMLAFSALAWWLLPRPLFWAHATTFALVFAIQVYVHDQFHIRRSWLNRFTRFRTLRRLHKIHHLRHGRNFSVLEPLWDRCLGTFARRGA